MCGDLCKIVHYFFLKCVLYFSVFSIYIYRHTKIDINVQTYVLVCTDTHHLGMAVTWYSHNIHICCMYNN